MAVSGYRKAGGGSTGEASGEFYDMPKFKAMLALSASLFAAATPSLAADADKEIRTAATHAGLAAKAESPALVKTHLQHVLNCLEGPSGADFNAGPGNPCKDQGAGAIPDSEPDEREKLEAAARQAKLALAEPDVNKAKTIAASIQTSLSADED